MFQFEIFEIFVTFDICFDISFIVLKNTLIIFQYQNKL